MWYLLKCHLEAEYLLLLIYKKACIQVKLNFFPGCWPGIVRKRGPGEGLVRRFGDF